MMPQDGSLDFKLVQRVCLLQQALDQALDTLDELRLRVENHQLLESQLAQTEEYSNAQQKIITHLKEQLDEKSEWQNHILQKLLLGVQHMIDQQQLELERLRIRIQQSQSEVQEYLLRIKNYYQSAPADRLFEQDLELTSEVMVVRALTVSLSSQLQAAQQHIRELDTTLTQHQVNFARLLAYQESIARQFTDPIALPPVESEDWEEDPTALMQIVRAQQQKLEALDDELAEQFRQQNRLKYRCQELAAERDHYKRQIFALQQENEDLREQVLSQASQANEYEAAIHYWRQHSGVEG
ncbi:MAG: hypothetical protein ICV62_05685 [Cyanobacteria bacterium Co-bin13]|nr:hypothetical protein [Cyanobacteria bacterium Co-bin13]